MDVNHPYHHVNPSLGNNFAFLRISKCASETILNYKPFRIKRYHLVLINEYRDKIYCCFRNPIDRFISSIPETLLRYQIRHDVVNNFSDSVIVNQEIKNILDDMIIYLNKPEIFLDKYLTLLNKTFFDAHHSPQYSFISNIDGVLFKNLNFFLLENIDHAFQYICKAHDLKYEKIDLNNSHKIKFNKRSKIKNNIKMLLFKLGFIHKTFSYSNKNIYSANANLLYLNHPKWRILSKDKYFENKIFNLYKKDFIFYEKLKKSKKIISEIE